MNPRQNSDPNGADGAPLVIVKDENGFRVYSPTDPRKSYLVTGSSGIRRAPAPIFRRTA